MSTCAMRLAPFVWAGCAASDRESVLFPGCSRLRSVAIKLLLEVEIPFCTRHLLLIVAFGRGAIPLISFDVIRLARITASGGVEAHLQTPHVEAEDLVMFAGSCWGCGLPARGKTEGHDDREGRISLAYDCVVLHGSLQWIVVPHGAVEAERSRCFSKYSSRSISPRAYRSRKVVIADDVLSPTLPTWRRVASLHIAMITSARNPIQKTEPTSICKPDQAPIIPTDGPPYHHMRNLPFSANRRSADSLAP